MEQRAAWYVESVNGCVIGECTSPYEFWQDGNRVARGHFANDEEAVRWFEMIYPALFEQGAEMRVFE